jgi:hypothetical protein
MRSRAAGWRGTPFPGTEQRADDADLRPGAARVRAQPQLPAPSSRTTRSSAPPSSIRPADGPRQLDDGQVTTLTFGDDYPRPAGAERHTLAGAWDGDGLLAQRGHDRVDQAVAHAGCVTFAIAASLRNDRLIVAGRSPTAAMTAWVTSTSPCPRSGALRAAYCEETGGSVRPCSLRPGRALGRRRRGARVACPTAEGVAADPNPAAGDG